MYRCQFFRLLSAQSAFKKLSDISIYVFYEHLFIDELMIPHYGHHTRKMYMRGKPTGFRQKIYVVSFCDKYPYFMEQ
ncbi:hypothetical protein T4C_6889, partial [Trichinella pseudospiralis]